MPVKISTTPTPNPNAMKFTLDRTLVDKGSKTFDSAAEAAANPLAAALFGVPGVKSVFLLNSFITVTKDAAADWKSLVPELETAVRTHFK